MQQIHVKGIKSYAFHGCIPEERKAGGWFETNVIIEGDFRAAMQSDQLTDAVDYVTVSNICQEAMKVPSHLIEHVGQRIELKLAETFPSVSRITVEIIKHRAPIENDTAEVRFVTTYTHR